VLFDRVQRDRQLPGNILIGESITDQVQHLKLAWGQ